MPIDTRDENNIQQVRTSLQPSQAIANSYEDDPPPYPGLVLTASNRTTNIRYNQSIAISNNRHSLENLDLVSQRTIQARRWKTSYNQYHICYTGNLSDDFLRIKFSTTVQSDPSISYHFSTKLPTVKILKTQKLRARMLQNVLTQIEQGQTMKISMVPEEPPNSQ